MAFDGIVTYSIVSELNKLIIGGKINKIYEPTKNELVLDIYNGKKYLLNICIDSSNCRIHLTNHLKGNPKQAPNFCMLLRKYLTSSKIKNIETYNLDRLVIFTLESYNELNDLVEFKLIIELMGKHSNIILVNDKNNIIDSLRHIYSNQATRIILPANSYLFPASDKLNLLEISLEEFVIKINEEKKNNLVTTCSKLFTGVSKPFIIYTLEKLDINSDALAENDLHKLYNYIQNILLQKNICCKEFKINNKKDFTVEMSSASSINSFIDEFYFNKENNETFISYRNNVLKLILTLLTKQNKKLANIQEKLEECKEMDKYKLYGELITSNLYRINNNINIDCVKLENYYDNNNLITIPLDKKISPSLNAKQFFKKYNKLKNTLEIVTKQQIQIKSEVSYLESIVYSLESSKNIQEVYQIHDEIEENILGKTNNIKEKKNNNSELELSSVIIDNFNIYIGKNNKQNDYITFKLSDKNDLWFHVQGFHGSHILLKTNGKEIDDNNPIILKCAKLAAKYSKANAEKKVAVDYTLIKNIKKPKGSKPGFVIFNNYKTIIVEN